MFTPTARPPAPASNLPPPPPPPPPPPQMLGSFTVPRGRLAA